MSTTKGKMLISSSCEAKQQFVAASNTSKNVWTASATGQILSWHWWVNIAFEVALSHAL